MTVIVSPEATVPATATPAGKAPRAFRLPRGAHLWVPAWVVGMIFVPWVVHSDLWMNIGVFALIAAIGALGLQVIMGFTGQISMGHAAFMAVGAYTAAWLGVDHQQPVWVWLPAAALVSGLAGAVISPAAVRIRGLYLAVATLALVFIGAYTWETWASLTGGVSGRQAATVVIGGQDLLYGVWSGDRQVMTLFQAWWYFALAILLVLMVLTWNIKRSRLGRAFMAVRDRDLAAGVAGIPVTKTKVIAFAISSAYAGVSGALLAAFMGYITPTQWTLVMSVDFIAMVVIGGVGTIAGAVIGAFFVKAMPAIVTWISSFVPFISPDPKVDGGVTAPLLAQFLYGLVIVLVLLFEPRGLTAAFRKSFDALRSRAGRGAR